MSTEATYQTCFDKIIALSGTCEDVAPTSGLYSQVIGVNENFIAEIITREYKSPLEFWNEKKNFAIVEVTNAIHAHFLPTYKSVSLINSARCGYFQENKISIPGDAIKGLLFEVCNSDSFVDLFISELSLFTDFQGSIDVSVFDLFQNKVIDTIQVSSVAGEISSVYVNKLYKSNRKNLSLFFGYSSIGINSYKTLLTNKPCTTCSGAYQIRNSYETIQAGKFEVGEGRIKSNFKSLSETGGMSVIHSLKCNHSDWLCSVSNLLALPILYKTGSKHFEFALLQSPNSRTNNSVTLNKDLLKENYDLCEFKFRESLDNIIRSIKPPSDPKCFECRDNVRHVISLQ